MSQVEKIVIDIDLNIEDYRRALFWHNKSTFVFISIIFVFAILGTGFVGFKEGDAISLILFGLTIPFYILYVVSSLLSVKRQSKNLAEISEKTIFKFNEKRVESQSESTLIATTWERFAKICETKTDFIFFSQNNIFYPIPKRFFINESQIDDFKQLIKEKLGEKAKLK